MEGKYAKNSSGTVMRLNGTQDHVVHPNINREVGDMDKGAFFSSRCMLLFEWLVLAGEKETWG